MGFHTMFLLALVSVFLYLAALCMFVYVCVVRPFGALLRILNIFAAIPLFPRCSWSSPIARACACCVGGAELGFHTMFLLYLVSVLFHLAALYTFGYVRVVQPLGALRRIFNIPVRLSIVFPWSVAAPYLLRFSFFFVVYLAVLGGYGGRMGIYGCGSCLCACFMTCVVVRCSFLRAVLSLWRPPSQHTWFPHLRMCSGGNTWGRNILVCHTFVFPWSVVVGGCWCFVLSLVLVWCLSFFFVFLFFFDVHKSPSSYGTHFARWFGARNVQILRPRSTLVLGALCVS